MKQLVADSSECLIARIAIELFTAFVPFDDAAAEIPRTNRFVREVDESALERELGLDVFLGRDVARDLGHADDRA